MTAALRRSFNSLEIPNYRRYFAGQIVSLSGNWMQMVAEMWLVLELTGSGVAGDVDLGVALVDHVCAQLEQAVDDPEHRVLVAGDEA